MTTRTPRVVLHLTSPLRLATDDGVLPVRRMGLAILAYLALEGPTRRERLADVIWGHRQALHNLRVELHRLRTAFASVGMTPLQPIVDPLALAPGIEVAPADDAGELLLGLEDISADYQAWIEHRRGLAEHVLAASGREGLLGALARTVHPPFVLVLQGIAGSGRRTLAWSLAHRLHLPFEVGPAGSRGAVRYLPPELHGVAGLADRIRHDRDSVWVIGRSAYGVDSRLLLDLRASLPPERWRFEKLRPLTWREAQRSFLAGVVFDEGAALYLASGGHPGYLRELLALRGAATNGAAPMPQRVRASVVLEAQELSEPGRQALAHLSAFDGRLSRVLVAAVGAEAALEELELHGWLRFQDGTWQFADPIVARVLRAELPPGVRDRLHRAVARAVAHAGDDDGSGASHRANHGRIARRSARHDAGFRARDARARAAAPSWVTLVPGNQLALDVPRRNGSDVDIVNSRVIWSRLGAPDGATVVSWSLPGVPLLLRVVGRFATERDGQAAPLDRSAVLRMRVAGTGAPRVALAPVPAPIVDADGEVWLPADGAFDHWLRLPPDARGLDLACARSSIVLEAEIILHRSTEPGTGASPAVVATDLVAASKRSESTGALHPLAASRA